MARTSTRGTTSTNKEQYEERLNGHFALRVYDTKTEKDRYTAYLNVAGVVTIKCNLVYTSKNNGFFLSFPSYKGKDGYKDLCYPITKEAREEINKLVEMISEVMA